MSQRADCAGQHHYFVADVAVVEATGEVHVIMVCTQCGDAKKHSFPVAPPTAEIKLLSKEKEK